MSDVYESIVAGLQEAIEDAKSKEKKLPRRVVTVVPVKEYNASEVKKIRNETGMSQKTFASYLGVSCKTVEAWESGYHPHRGGYEGGDREDPRADPESGVNPEIQMVRRKR